MREMIRGSIYLIICGPYRKVGRSTSTSMCVSILRDHFPVHNRLAYIFPVNNYEEAYKDLVRWIIAEEYVSMDMIIPYMYTLYAVYGNRGRIHVIRPKPRRFKHILGRLMSNIIFRGRMVI